MVNELTQPPKLASILNCFFSKPLGSTKQLAWVRAEDETDSKLSFANGFSYLVRTVDLSPGKNRFEILVDGERAFRATYSMK